MHEDFETEARRIKEELTPLITGYEKTRRRHLVFLFLTIPVIWLISIPVFFIYGFLTVFNLYIALFAALVVATLEALALFKLFDYEYRRRVKIGSFMKEVSKAFDAEYSPSGYFRAGSLYDHFLLPRYGRDIAEDGFKIELSGRIVTLQEIRFYAHNKDFRSVHFNRLITRGLIIRIPSRKYQAHHTLSIPKSFLKKHYLKSFYLGLAHYEQVPFGNRALGKKYTILSEHPTDAHDIFDPAFTERFLELKKTLGAKNLSISFKADEVILFARDPHDFFEVTRLLQPISLQTIQNVLKEIHQIDEIIKILKLNPYVGL